MPSALFVTTVDITLEAFLLPFADHFRTSGWHIDAAANGATSNERIRGHFDERFEVAWSRNPLSSRNVIGTSRRLRRLVRAGDYDVVWIHTPIAAWVTRFALRTLRASSRQGAASRNGPVVIYTAHGFHFYPGQKPLPHALYRAMERIAARWTDFLVCINRPDFDAARTFRGIARDRVRYIPGIGVDCDVYSPAAANPATRARVREDLALAEDDLAIAMVAEFGPVKRHAFALDALSLVRDARIKLVLVGTGPLESSIRERVAALRLGKRVRFAGYRRDMPVLLASCDALLLCSEREGLARSVLEGMASGLPIFGTQTRGIADAVEPVTTDPPSSIPEVRGPAGWITSKDDPGALAKAIEAAIANPAELAKRGAHARRLALARFDVEAIIAEYDTLFRTALDAPDARVS